MVIGAPVRPVLETLDRLERSQNCILLSPFAMQFLSTFLSKMPRFGGKKKFCGKMKRPSYIQMRLKNGFLTIF